VIRMGYSQRKMKSGSKCQTHSRYIISVTKHPGQLSFKIQIFPRPLCFKSLQVLLPLIFSLELFPTGTENFSLHHRVQNGSGAHLASYPKGTRSCLAGRKAAEIQNAWSYTSTPPIRLNEVVLSYAQGQIYLYLL
jgi:hypothetical protein